MGGRRRGAIVFYQHNYAGPEPFRFPLLPATSSDEARATIEPGAECRNNFVVYRTDKTPHVLMGIWFVLIFVFDSETRPTSKWLAVVSCAYRVQRGWWAFRHGIHRAVQAHCRCPHCRCPHTWHCEMLPPNLAATAYKPSLERRYTIPSGPGVKKSVS
eukprot:SAG11_NODE_8882_length_967_cov_1.072581_2_plen_158_part_00